MYIFSTDYIQSHFLLTYRRLDIIEIFSIRVKLELNILHERACRVGVYTPKQSRKGHCIFFLTNYIPSNFVFNIWVSR